MSLKLSLFTPTHNPRFLGETWQSVKNQDYENFEWLIMPNGRALDSLPVLERLAEQDKRIRLLPVRYDFNSVGLAKATACRACEGDAFIELDHDDMLAPGALSRISAAFATGAGFVYSDSAAFETTDGGTKVKPRTYTPRNGWKSYPVTAYGHEFVATRAFPLSPRSLCEVYYAPDHVRAWSRQAYQQTGGHDEMLEVADDHDLICRTYIAGMPFAHTGACDYFYRWHGENTVQVMNQKIQTNQADNRDRYVAAIVREWSKRCGYKVINIDNAAALSMFCTTTAAEHDQYGQIILSNAFQYLTPEKYVNALKRLYDCLAPSGFLHVAVPDAESRWADQDPFHRIRFNPNSFLYFGDPAFRGIVPGSDGVVFETVGVRSMYPSPEFERRKMATLRFDLCAIKGQNHPGPAHGWYTGPRDPDSKAGN